MAIKYAEFNIEDNNLCSTHFNIDSARYAVYNRESIKTVASLKDGINSDL